MATVQIISSPDRIKPSPVENCIQFCFAVSDVISEPALNAAACFNATGVTYPDSFLFAGVQVNVGTGPGELDLNGGNASAIFAAWLNSTYPFNTNTTITSSSAIVCVEWNEAGPQPNFTFNEGDESFIIFQEGTNIEITPGFKFVYQLMCYDPITETSKPLCPMQQRHIQLDVDGNVIDICVDVEHELSDHVYTDIPDCDDGLIFNEPMTKHVFLTYGYVQTNEEAGCGVTYGPFQDTPIIPVINQAINLEDGEDGFEDYSYVSLNPIKFLTTKPVNDIIVCEKTCEWLFLTGTHEAYFGAGTVYSAMYNFFDENGALLQTDQLDIADDGVLQIPAGPGNISGFSIPPGACSYTIHVEVASLLLPAGRVYSEVATFRLDKNCCCDVGVYFLDPKGGYTRIPFDCITSEDFISSMDEICLDIECGTFDESLMNGKTQLNSEGYTQINLVSNHFKKTKGNTCLLRAFKASESKFYLFTDKQGQTNNRRVTFAPGNTRIMEKDGKLIMTLSIIESQSYRSISQN